MGAARTARSPLPGTLATPGDEQRAQRLQEVSPTAHDRLRHTSTTQVLEISVSLNADCLFGTSEITSASECDPRQNGGDARLPEARADDTA